MKIRFTKMQGAGNDFVVLDATQAPLALDGEAMRRLGDRRFGVGADQILVVERSQQPGVDFNYRIFNGGTGDEVEQCGNGARCFVRYVHDKQLSDKTTLRVQTMNTLLELTLRHDGRVAVDMNRPIFEPGQVPFDASGLVPLQRGQATLWPLVVGETRVELAVLSMGNPHAVVNIAQWGATDVDEVDVPTLGPQVQSDHRFARGVNVGFLQVLNRSEVRLRVHERGAGETLACGTGACAAVVAGIRQGLLDARVDVHTRGGLLTIEWAGGEHPVMMTGPAQTVFEGEIEL